MTLKNDCVFEQNRASNGAGIKIEWGSASISNTVFRGNTASSSGAAVSAYDRCSLSIKDSSLIGNSAKSEGGGIHISDHSAITIKHSMIKECEAIVEGGGVFAARHCNITLHSLLFSKNSAGHGGALYVSQNIFIHIDNSELRNNKGFLGGVIFGTLNKVFLTVQDTTFLRNYATSEGGVIHVFHAWKIFICNSCTFFRNIADSYSAIKISKADELHLKSCVFEENHSITLGYNIFVMSKGLARIAYSSFKGNKLRNDRNDLHIRSDSVTILNCSFESDFSFKIEKEFIIDSCIGVSQILLSAAYIKISQLETVMSHCGIVLEAPLAKRITLTNVAVHCTKHEAYQIMSKGSTDESYIINGSIHYNQSIIVGCRQCQQNQYLVNKSSFQTSQTLPMTKQELVNYICQDCSVGGVCIDSRIISLPGYWGFVHRNKVHFETCPSSYCCQESPCQTYDGCNAGRSGTLCSKCKSDYQLALMNEVCIKSDECTTLWVAIIIFGSALFYMVFLLVKNEFVNIALGLENLVVKGLENINKISSQVSPFVPNLGMNSECEDEAKITQVNEYDINEGVSRNSDVPFIDTNMKDTDESLIICENNTDRSTVAPEEYENINMKDIADIKHEAIDNDQIIEGQRENTARRIVEAFETPFDPSEIFNILIFHLQDTAFFLVDLPSLSLTKTSFEEIMKQITIISQLSVGLFSFNTICFPEWVTELHKLLINTSVVPVMICFLLLSRLFLLCIPKKWKHKIYCIVLRAFLLIIMFSSQKLSTTAFSLLNCLYLGDDSYLFIDTSITCYQPWQFLALLYLIVFILPLWLAFLIGPGLLRFEFIGVDTLLFGFLCPAPFLVHWIYKIQSIQGEGEIKITVPDEVRSCILDQVWYSFKPFSRFTYLSWGGMIELRRLLLVIFSVLISSPIVRIWCMVCVVLIGSCIHIKHMPYSDWAANIVALFSLLAIVFVGIVNTMWATLSYLGATFDAKATSHISNGFMILQTILSQGFCFAVVFVCSIWFLRASIMRRCRKYKK